MRELANEDKISSSEVLEMVCESALLLILILLLFLLLVLALLLSCTSTVGFDCLVPAGLVSMAPLLSELLSMSAT